MAADNGSNVAKRLKALKKPGLSPDQVFELQKMALANQAAKVAEREETRQNRDNARRDSKVARTEGVARAKSDGKIGVADAKSRGKVGAAEAKRDQAVGVQRFKTIGKIGAAAFGAAGGNPAALGMDPSALDSGYGSLAVVGAGDSQSAPSDSFGDALGGIIDTFKGFIGGGGGGGSSSFIDAPSARYSPLERELEQSQANGEMRQLELNKARKAAGVALLVPVGIVALVGVGYLAYAKGWL